MKVHTLTVTHTFTEDCAHFKICQMFFSLQFTYQMSAISVQQNPLVLTLVEQHSEHLNITIPTAILMLFSPSSPHSSSAPHPSSSTHPIILHSCLSSPPHLFTFMSPHLILHRSTPPHPLHSSLTLPSHPSPLCSTLTLLPSVTPPLSLSPVPHPSTPYPSPLHPLPHPVLHSLISPTFITLSLMPSPSSLIPSSLTPSHSLTSLLLLRLIPHKCPPE